MAYGPDPTPTCFIAQPCLFIYILSVAVFKLQQQFCDCNRDTTVSSQKYSLSGPVL